MYWDFLVKICQREVFKRDRIQTAKELEREENIETNEAVRNEFS